MNLNSLRFLKSIITSNFRRLSFPFKISYAVTYRCNLKCKMCNIWKKDAELEKNELKLQDIESFFMRANKCSWLGITGGEPFLRKDLRDLVDISLKYCRNLGAIHFASNGTLGEKILDTTRYIIEKHKDLKIVYTISIDGYPSLHNEIRGSSSVWEKAIETFKSLKEINPRVKAQIGFTLSNHNLSSFEETYNALKDAYPKLKFDDINVNVFQRSGFYYENKDMEPIAEDKLRVEINKILNMDKEGLTINNFLRRRYLKLYLKYLETKKCPLKCQALSSTCYMDPYGNLYPCAVYNKRLLNVKDLKENLEVEWNSGYAKQLSGECATNKCPSCWSPCDAFSAIGGSLLKAI